VVLRDDPTGGKGEALNAEPYRERFIEAMNDDFNTAQALAVLFDLARVINQAGDAGISFISARYVISELARDVLGLRLDPFDLSIREPERGIEPVVNSLSEARNALRRIKQFELADRIRAKINEMNIILEDDRGETTIKWEPIRDSRPLDLEPLLNLLAEVIPVLKEFNQLELINIIQVRLKGLNITLEDTPEGTVIRWKRKR
jgi:hypothetical protein